MRRAKYRLGEVLAGKTMFMPCNQHSSLWTPYVLEFLVGSEREPMPAEGERFPYRVRPSIARKWASDGYAYKTRNAAMRSAILVQKLFGREEYEGI